MLMITLNYRLYQEVILCFKPRYTSKYGITNSFAVADTEASKPVHTGLKFELTQNQLRLIGVDGYRLAIRTETVKYDGEDISFIVPKKTIRELIKLLIQKMTRIFQSV